VPYANYLSSGMECRARVAAVVSGQILKTQQIEKGQE
jgi:hypothetical protein